ncbi:TPA: hypothetical protein N0F65_005508 [Lagenidium giganteum]|uniref:Endoplasmic reticulum-Golgi intermediate compartment protein n=1 Tax=Lagenidium giganteum TaxID=4803 RepID=A0AAV2YIM9_9STRA|nr:TPA: hypothetical protein N0F65_005508 [Lagenidium giganteum]
MAMRYRAAKSDVDDVGLNGEASESSFTRSARRALKRVDVYPKMHREFKVQTDVGGTVSLITGIIMLVLFLSELRDYMSVKTHEHMVVDKTINEKLQINLDISFLALSCKDAHVNAMDVAGELQMNMHQTVTKIRLDQSGNQIGRPMSMLGANAPTKVDVPPNYCGSCYDATHPAGKKCCNTCDEVKEAFMASDVALEEADQKEQCIRESVEEETLAQDGEGCRFQGKMMVNRVAGNFHVALGRTFHREGRLVHQFRPGQEYSFNATHVIHSLSFGTPIPGAKNPLDGMKKVTERVGGVFQYYVKVVPTIYSDISSKETYQFSYTEQTRYLDPTGQMSALPGTFFVFDLSPFMVKVDNDRVPFLHFLTRVCAIIGGMISISGFVDSFIFNYLHVRGGTAASASTKFG